MAIMPRYAPLLAFVCTVLALTGCGDGGEPTLLEPGAYLAEGEAELSVAAGTETRTESIGVFVGDDGVPTHVYDQRWGELSELEFLDGAALSENACAEHSCDWRVERDSGCVQISYEEFFRVAPYDDTGHIWTGNLRVCPSATYPHEVVAHAESRIPWLMPGDALILEADYPFDPDEDEFEVVADGIATTPTPTPLADGQWRLEVPPAFDSLQVRAVGSRGVSPTRVPEPVPTTATVDDWTFATEPPPGSVASYLDTTHQEGALVFDLFVGSFGPLSIVLALGETSATALTVELEHEIPTSGEVMLHTVRGDAGPSVPVERDSVVPVPSGAGNVWLVLRFDPFGHPQPFPGTLSLKSIAAAD